ncbi:hypothetical protein F441_00449 [Phytophthora nicotianae CJ01A1]|uniref:Uncharacterized protein n=4 Tax=Phytophthora nicotianae TaxID=4792 RepID=V9DWD0_PHYNI|nr:hypothetical protein PPTG_20722 [Phytophthora nicotianae INRA-310]ETI30023.1 hypothetical protein F443_22856 [Phytophthora nicotianae P1569]ETK96972.1 hypothetical protein L915_00418 [Phytophthora nicotianae]ETP26983.1 hypothetical protein F441_00449 [Phytophthora nicotianae CJ01A1]ETI30322.1 hypothetical protein F443_22558 [Phytophthora nicotianae P1569]ETL50319.1 hypothetical protein L916_00421 [Phytophthora nicotianae]
MKLDYQQQRTKDELAPRKELSFVVFDLLVEAGPWLRSAFDGPGQLEKANGTAASFYLDSQTTNTPKPL